MRLLGSLVALILLAASPAYADDVRVKDLGRFLGWRENALVGYGIVTGLAGSGDSPRSELTRQALKNVLSRLGTNVSADQIQSRNVAAVIVTAALPPAANVGDRIDVTVSSIGDARSLVGGTLLMTPLLGPDQRPYALAQGSLVVGGYRFDANLNREQKNYPAAGVVPGGATVETAVTAELVGSDGALTFLLADPDAATAERLASAINAAVGAGEAKVRDSGAVLIDARAGEGDIYRLIAAIGDVRITPDSLARVVINERSGTVVAGGGVRISSVVVSQGDVRVSVSVENQASQPSLYGGYAPNLRGLIVTNTKLAVTSPTKDAVVSFPDTTVADLVEGLSQVHVDTRGVIAVLQAVKAAGALHADIIVQ
ncbi:MAG: flagellar basal body P-ring protein FlgI [Caulobacterales bacterium]